VVGFVCQENHILPHWRLLSFTIQRLVCFFV
jgi:hypothetical protein